MSLDVYLYSTGEHKCSACEHTDTTKADLMFEANITHNLTKMASEAGIYECLWRPDECGIKTASQVAAVLRGGIERLRTDPARFEKFDAPNGWGRYVHFVPWCERYLEACLANPTALVEVCR